jgi:mannose-6-phosphate isomerase-like protein (cupin superfamily)
MFVKKEDSEEKKNSDSCTVWEYSIPSRLFSFASALINGRYPDKGSVKNSACEEGYYVLSGTGVIHSEKGDFMIKKGDLYHFEKEEVYWVEGKNLSIVLVNSPPWSPDQHHQVN